jgi:tRNA (guanine10-N2)-dimethyltransferase
MIVFRISGEHASLPREELRSLYEASGKKLVIDSEDGLLVLANDLDTKTLLRLSFTHEFYPVEKITDRKHLDSVLLALGLKKSKTFCVRCMGFENNPAEERGSGEVIFEALRIPVNLRKPDVTVYLLKVKDKIAVSTKRYATDDFSKRDQNKRPFFRPVALPPKLARLFVNLARAKKGDTLLDPFCGAGSILIEAGEIGLKPIGRDLDRKMVWGCRRNLEFYKMKPDVEIEDATKITEKNLDAIVTDPPYARASKVFTNNLLKMYLDFLKSAFKALKPGGYLVAAAPSTKGLPFEKTGFEKIGAYDYYVHASLTRRIYILRKPK